MNLGWFIVLPSIFCPTFQRRFWYFQALKIYCFLGSPLLEDEDAHSLLLLLLLVGQSSFWPIRLGGLVEEILRLNSFMRSSITKSRWLENSSRNSNWNSSRISSRFHLFHYGHQDDMRQLNWFTTIIWKALEEFCQADGCCYAQRSICVPSAALWAFLHEIIHKLKWFCCQNPWKLVLASL